MKMKEIGRDGACVSSATSPLDPPMQYNILTFLAATLIGMYVMNVIKYPGSTPCQRALRKNVVAVLKKEKIDIKIIFPVLNSCSKSVKYWKCFFFLSISLIFIFIYERLDDVKMIRRLSNPNLPALSYETSRSHLTAHIFQLSATSLYPFAVCKHLH